jgi:hypothetical protein
VAADDALTAIVNGKELGEAASGADTDLGSSDDGGSPCQRRSKQQRRRRTADALARQAPLKAPHVEGKPLKKPTPKPTPKAAVVGGAIYDSFTESDDSDADDSDDSDAEDEAGGDDEAGDDEAGDDEAGDDEAGGDFAGGDFDDDDDDDDDDGPVANAHIDAIPAPDCIPAPATTSSAW